MFEQLGEQVIEVILEEVRRQLELNSKVVTRRTYESQRGVFLELQNRLQWVFFSDEALIFIESGKRANTKLPLQANGQLVERLQEWKDELNIDISDYVLAATIARNPRAGVEIIAPALEIAIPRVMGLIEIATARELERDLAERIRSRFIAA